MLARRHLQAGVALVVEADHEQGDERLARFRCLVRRGEEPVAAALLNVYLPEPEGAAPP